MPQGQRQIATMGDPGILSYACSPEPIPVAVIVMSKSFFELITSASKVASIKQCDSEQKQGFHQHAWVVIRFGKSERFIRKDKGEIHLPANYAPGKIPEYHGELLLWLANGRTNLACTLKDRTNFGRRVASGRDVCRAQWI